MGAKVSDVALSMTSLTRDGDSFIGPLVEHLRGRVIPAQLQLPPPTPAHDNAMPGERERSWDRWKEWSRITYLYTRVADDQVYRDAEGEPLNTFELVLNAALRVGGDAIKLFARLYGQCELHAWVAQANRRWLADIIEAGRASNIMRGPDALREWGTWEGVIALLRNTRKHPGPVVTSYSVCDTFNFRDLKALRETKGLELKPDDWNTFYFGAGTSLLDVFAAEHGKLVVERKAGR